MAANDLGPEDAEHVEIVEVGPRDGLQNEARVLSVDDRIDMVDRAARAGARRIEAVSFVKDRKSVV